MAEPKNAYPQSANVTAQPGDLIRATAAITVTLPAPKGMAAWQSPQPSNGWEVTVNNVSAGSVTVQTSDGSLIDGSASATVTAGSRASFTAWKGAWYRSV